MNVYFLPVISIAIAYLVMYIAVKIDDYQEEVFQAKKRIEEGKK